MVVLVVVLGDDVGASQLRIWLSLPHKNFELFSQATLSFSY